MIQADFKHLLDTHLLTVNASFNPFYIISNDDWTISTIKTNEQIGIINAIIENINKNILKNKIKPIEFKRFIFPKDSIVYLKTKPHFNTIFFNVKKYRNQFEYDSDLTSYEVETTFKRIKTFSNAKSIKSIETLSTYEKKSLIHGIKKNNIHPKMIKYIMEMSRNAIGYGTFVKEVEYTTNIQKIIKLISSNWELNRNSPFFS